MGGYSIGGGGAPLFPPHCLEAITGLIQGYIQDSPVAYRQSCIGEASNAYIAIGEASCAYRATKGRPVTHRGKRRGCYLIEGRPVADVGL